MSQRTAGHGFNGIKDLIDDGHCCVEHFRYIASIQRGYDHLDGGNARLKAIRWNGYGGKADVQEEPGQERIY